MTIEHRVVLDLSDVRAIRLECATCQAAVVVQLDQTFRFPRVCPGCQETWGGRDQPSPLEQTVVGFVDALKAARRVMSDRQSRVPVRARMEIDRPALER